MYRVCADFVLIKHNSFTHSFIRPSTKYLSFQTMSQVLMGDEGQIEHSSYI